MIGNRIHYIPFSKNNMASGLSPPPLRSASLMNSLHFMAKAKNFLLFASISEIQRLFIHISHKSGFIETSNGKSESTNNQTYNHQSITSTLNITIPLNLLLSFRKKLKTKSVFRPWIKLTEPWKKSMPKLSEPNKRTIV